MARSGSKQLEPRVMPLEHGWAIQAAHNVRAASHAVSSAGFDTKGWHPATMPATVLGALVQAGVYEQPFFADNLKRIPGQGPPATNFSNFPMPDDSPFKGSWWFRCEFDVARDLSFSRHWLQLDGVNYRADIWLNGQLLADRKAIQGAYRSYELDVTQALKPGQVNVLALEICPPNPCDLGITWVDWNPSPPDKNMGIWRDVRLVHGNEVSLRGTQVSSKLSPDHTSAQIAVHADLHNSASEARRATVTVRFAEHPDWHLSKVIEVPAGAREHVELSASEFPQLEWRNPKLWWPRQLGAQALYHAQVEVIVDGVVSDHDAVRFGIREIRCDTTPEGYALFSVNGQKLLIRGGGWATDLFLRRQPERDEQELAYVLDLNLNTIRFEGMLERNEFLARCDEEGLLVMAGWCCCDHWEKWENWAEGDVEIAVESLRSQLRRVRNHPCLLNWMYGSDFAPPAEVERRYLAAIAEERWPNPVHSSASHRPAELTGASGMKMHGPYDYVPPNYWTTDSERGGAFGLATEISPGPAVPPIESLRRMIPEDQLWPIGELWNYHAGGQKFSNIQFFTDALNARYGTAKSAEDFANKAQLMTYEAQRAMFEAYIGNKYRATGVVQWMLNNAWPSLIWHLYDHFLRPAGGYFGTKKACEDVHIQYSPGNRAIVVVNNRRTPVSGLIATTRVLDPDGVEAFRLVHQLDIQTDGCVELERLPELPQLPDAYFLHLALSSGAQSLSSNFYWLSQKPDVLDHANGDWFHTPVTSHADFSSLFQMPKASVPMKASLRQAGAYDVVSARVTNGSSAIAFFCQLRLAQGNDVDVLPIVWDDNYLSLLPGEQRVIEARFAREHRLQGPLELELRGVNVNAQRVVVSEPGRSASKSISRQNVPGYGAFLEDEAK